MDSQSIHTFFTYTLYNRCVVKKRQKDKGADMAGNTFQRMEKKMIVPTDRIPELTQRIGAYMKPDAFNVGGKPYTICNLYFDEPDDDVIRTSVALPWYKEKLRLRSYGTPEPDSKVFLELKKKCNKVGTKRRTKLPYSAVQRYLTTGEHPAGLSYIDEQVLREIDYYRSHHDVAPRVYVSYLRNAYFGIDDPEFRVTFDSDILTRRYDLDLSLGRYGEPALSPGVTLVEVKFAGAVPLWFCRVMSELGLSFHTFSKVGTNFKLHTYERACREHPDEAHTLRLIH